MDDRQGLDEALVAAAGGQVPGEHGAGRAAGILEAVLEVLGAVQGHQQGDGDQERAGPADFPSLHLRQLGPADELADGIQKHPAIGWILCRSRRRTRPAGLAGVLP